MTLSLPPSGIERLKQASRFLRGDIAADLAAPGAEVSEASYNLLKFHGTYEQHDRDTATRRKQRGEAKEFSFMVRVRMPGGMLTPAQYLALVIGLLRFFFRTIVSHLLHCSFYYDRRRSATLSCDRLRLVVHALVRALIPRRLRWPQGHMSASGRWRGAFTPARSGGRWTTRQQARYRALHPHQTHQSQLRPQADLVLSRCSQRALVMPAPAPSRAPPAARSARRRSGNRCRHATSRA
jgi:hypothetical protein